MTPVTFTHTTPRSPVTALPGRVHWRFYPGLQGLHLALGAPCCLPQVWVWTARPSSTGVRLGLSDLSAAQPSLWPSALLSGLGIAERLGALLEATPDDEQCQALYDGVR